MWWKRKSNQQTGKPSVNPDWQKNVRAESSNVVRMTDNSVVYQQMPPGDRIANCPRCGSRAGLSSSGKEGEFQLAHFVCRACGMTITYRYKSTDDYEAFYWR